MNMDMTKQSDLFDEKLAANNIECNYVWRIDLFRVLAWITFGMSPRLCYSILLNNYQDFNCKIPKGDRCGYETHSEYELKWFEFKSQLWASISFYVCYMGILLFSSQGSVLKTDSAVLPGRNISSYNTDP